MKSRLPLLDLKGSIALLTLLVGTAAFALIPTNTQKLTEPAAAASGAGHTTFTSVLKGRGNNLPLFGLSDASVTTDKGDYSPGQVVHITGSGFGPGETVAL